MQSTHSVGKTFLLCAFNTAKCFAASFVSFLQSQQKNAASGSRETKPRIEKGFREKRLDEIGKKERIPSTVFPAQPSEGKPSGPDPL